MSKADGISVNVGGGYRPNIRFAANRISTAGGVINATARRPEHVRPEARRRDDERSSRTSRSSARSSSRKRSRSLSPDDPETMPALGAADVRAGERLLRFDGQSHAGRSRARCADGARARAQSGRSQGRGFHHRERRRQRARQQQRTVRVQSGDERELHAHRSHRRRHRLGLGGRRSSGLEAARLSGLSRSTRSRRRGCRAIPSRSSPGATR